MRSQPAVGVKISNFPAEIAMNKRLISYILGWVMLIEGATMLLPTVVGVIYHDKITLVRILEQSLVHAHRSALSFDDEIVVHHPVAL